MADKFIAQRDVEYLHELLSKEADENQRMILLRLLADAEKKLQEAEGKVDGTNTRGDT